LIRNHFRLKGIAELSARINEPACNRLQQMPLTGSSLRGFAANRPRKWINDHQSFNNRLGGLTHMTISRLIEVTRHIPDGSQDIVNVSPVELVLTDADCRFLLLGDRFPSIEEFNRILMSGRGDDGFVPHTWTGFALTELEYDEIRTRPHGRPTNIAAGNAGWRLQFRFAVHAGWSRVPELWTLVAASLHANLLLLRTRKYGGFHSLQGVRNTASIRIAAACGHRVSCEAAQSHFRRPFSFGFRRSSVCIHPHFTSSARGSRRRRFWGLRRCGYD